MPALSRRKGSFRPGRRARPAGLIPELVRGLLQRELLLVLDEGQVHQLAARLEPGNVLARGHLDDDTLLYTGKSGDKFSDVFPFTVTADVLRRGQERYNIYCRPCHDGAGTSFLKALSHQAPSPSHLPLEYFAGRFLTVLAASSLAFGIIHVELDLLRWLVRRWRHGSAGEERWDSI